MEISAKAVMDLRAKTGVSMMACKRALAEAQGNEELAVDILRKSGEAKAVSKADRETKEGVVAADIRGSKGVIVKVSCETDFVARNEGFVQVVKQVMDIAFADGAAKAMEAGETIAKEAIVQLGENIRVAEVLEIEGPMLVKYEHSNSKAASIVALDGGDETLGKDLAMHVVASQPAVVHPDSVDATDIEKEKDVYRDQLKAEGKPENIIENILTGKVKKFKEQQALLTQEFVKDPSQKVADILGNASVAGFIRASI